MYYRIGEGHKEYIPDKTVDEEFRLLTIAAICDECRSCGVQLIRRFANYPSDRVIFIDDICATAKGYQQFALKSLKALEKRSEQ